MLKIIHHQGFSLLEVLIALFILSLSLLGLAALHTNSLKFNHSAYLYSQAITLSTEMLERMRANLIAIMPTNQQSQKTFQQAGYKKNQASFYHAMYFQSLNNKNSASCNPSIPACHLAYADFQDWRRQIATLLPQAQWRICNTNQNDMDCSQACTAAVLNSTIHTITLCWTENIDSNATTNKKHVNITVQL